MRLDSNRDENRTRGEGTAGVGENRESMTCASNARKTANNAVFFCFSPLDGATEREVTAFIAERRHRRQHNYPHATRTSKPRITTSFFNFHETIRTRLREHERPNNLLTFDHCMVVCFSRKKTPIKKIVNLGSKGCMDS